MAIQTQTNLQLRKKGLDDVFHRTIIALERLELFLMMTANDNKQVTRSEERRVGKEC